MMKKVCTLFLAGLMASAALTSCSGGDDLLTYKYNYDLSEYIDLADYKGLPAEGYEFSLTDEQLQLQILSTRTYYSRSNVITDRAAQVGDIVYVDYVSTIDGKEFEGGSETGVELTIGFGTFIDEFENALIGTYAGDHVSVDGTFPEPYPEYPELSGETVHFEIDVTEVREQELPEYTDDFVRAYLGYESIEDYEKNLVILMEEHYKDIFYESVITQIWPVLMENTVVKKYPEDQLKQMYDDMVASYQAFAKAQGVNFADYCSAVLGMTEDEFYEYCQTDVETTIKEEMICYAIARAENFTLSDEEYTKRATEYAIEFYELSSLDELEAMYDKEVLRHYIMTDMVKEIVADYAAITYIG